MSFDFSMIMDIFNYVMIGIIALCALFGLWRGMKKSIYFMVWTCIVFLGGWFAMDYVCNFVLTVNLSAFGIPAITLGENTYEVTSAQALITSILTDTLFPNADLKDSVTLAFALGAVKMVVKLVWFLILCILSGTVFKWISDLVWLIFFRPRRKKDKETGKKLPRKKPKGILRLVGLGVGAVKGVCFVLIFCFLISGIASVVSSLVQYEEEKTTLERYDVVLLSNTLTVVREESTDSSSLIDNYIPDEYREIIDMICSYRDTVPGKIFGTIKIDDTPLDEYVFDGLFSIDIDTGTEENSMSLKLRKELCTIAEVVNTFNSIDPTILENFSMDKIAEIDTTVISDAVKKLSELQMVKLIIPVGIEVVLMSDLLAVDDDATPSDAERNQEIKDLIENNVDALKKYDLAKDIETLGYAFVDVCDLLKDQDLDNIDPFSFDTEVVEDLTDKLGELGIVDIVAPVVINYVVDMDSVKSMFTEMGLEIDDLKLDEIENWGEEIGQIGTLYTKFVELGITKEMLNTQDYSSLDVDKVNGLVDAIFESKLLENAIPVLGNYALTFLPDDYKDLISIPKDMDWKNELKPLMEGALTLLQTNILTSENMVDSLGDLSDETIEKLASSLSKSKIITGSLNGIIENLLASSDGEGLLGDISISGFTQAEIDAGTAWTEDEISAIFLSAKTLVSSGILTADDKIDAIKNLEAETLATHLSNSTFFKRNLSSVLDYLMGTLVSGEEKMEISALSEEEWTREELSSIFTALQEVVNMDLIGEGTDVTSAMENLNDEKIDSLSTSLSSSKFFTRNFSSLINYLVGDMDLGGVEIEANLSEEECNYTEISSIFKSAKLLLSYTSDENKSVLDILTASEEELDPILHSKLICDAVSSYLTDNESLKDTLKGTEDVDSWSETYLESAVNVAVAENNVTITNFEDGNYYDVYVGEKYLGFTKTATYTFSDGEEPSSVLVKARQKGELHKIFNAMGLLAKGAIKDNNLDTDKLVSNLINLTDTNIDELTSSIVITATVKDKLEALGEGEDSTLVVNPIANLNTELKALIKSVRLIFGSDVDINNLDTNVDNLLNKIIKLKNNIGAENEDDDEVGILLSSNILVDTITKVITDQGKGDSALLVVPENLTWKDSGNTAGEIRKIFSAIGILFGDDEIDISSISANKILSISDTNMDTLLASDILFETIKDKICNLGSTVVVNQDDISNWKAEIKNLVGAVKVILGDDADLNNVNIDANTLLGLEEEDVSKLTASIIITDTAVDKLYTIDAIKMPAGLTKESATWHTKENGKGELEQLILSIQALFGDNEVDTDNINANLILDADMDKVLASDIVLETVKDKIKALGKGEDATLVVKDAEDELNPDGKVLITNWRTEIKNLIGAVKVVLGDEANLNDVNIDTNKLLSLSDNDIAKLTASIIFTDTAVDKLYDITAIKMPAGLEKDSSEWHYTGEALYPARGELEQLIISMKAFFGTGGTVDTNNISADLILERTDSELDTVLASSVLLETVKQNVIALDTLATKGSTTIYVPTTDIENSVGGWKAEIKALLASAKCLLNEDPVTHKKSLTNADLNMNGILAPENKNTLLSSKIISHTIVETLTGGDYDDTIYIRSDGEYNWYGEDGELSKFMDSASLILKDESGNVGLNNFSCDNLLNLRNDIEDAENDDIRILLGSTILRDTIAKNIIGLSGTLSIPDSLNSATADAWNDNGTTAGEIRNILTACKTLFGGTGGSFSNANSFSVDTVMNKSKTDIADILGKSQIIKNTVAEKMVAIVYGGTMNGLIAEAPSTTGNQAVDRKNYIANDMVNMVYVLKDLSSVGIDYNSISYSAFTSAITSDAKAYLTADYITQSQVFTDSLSTMFNKIIGDQTFAVDTTQILSVINSLTANEWKNSHVENTNTYTYGELALMLRALSTFSNLDGLSTISSSVLRNTMGKVNASKILAPAMSQFITKALSSVDSWTRTSYSLTQVEWTYEIDVLASMLDMNLSDDLELSGSNAITSAQMGNMMRYISQSRILDIEKFMDKVGDAVDGMFGSNTYVDSMPLSGSGSYTSNTTGTLATTIVLSDGDVITSDAEASATTTATGYVNTNYDTFVSTWDTEIGKLVNCITALNNINMNFVDKTATGDSDVYQGAKNARGLGEFLDCCADTSSLSATVANVLNNALVASIAPTPAELTTYGNYANAMANKAKTIIALIP